MTRLNLSALTLQDYERAAEEYCRSLPLEHFMEAKPQATQREITLESLALLQARRPEVQIFNEMLVQYALPGRIGQVVPDNMIVVSDEPARAVGSYNIPFEKTGLLLVFEYVSSSSIRKDYKDSFRKYEKDLKVPYCLLFYPERQDLRVYHHENRRYRRLPPNDAGRYSIPELELEVGLQDGWVRFWYQGQLLELPAELQQNVEAANLRAAQQERRADQEKRRADQEKRRADQEKRRADKEAERREAAEREAAQLRALLEKLRGEQQGRKPPAT